VNSSSQFVLVTSKNSASGSLCSLTQCVIRTNQPSHGIPCGPTNNQKAEFCQYRASFRTLTLFVHQVTTVRIQYPVFLESDGLESVIFFYHCIIVLYHFDADPDPACHFEADWDPTLHFDADSDPDPSF
jgi:hypothetical protein